MPLDEQTAITLHLYDRPPINGIRYRSSLIALLGDARREAERDKETGAVRPGARSQSWLAATAYLILLDQVGKCFQIKGKSVPGDNAIVRTLQYFSQEDSATIDALYALRNALAHDYSLFNANVAFASRQHAFNFVADPQFPLVRLPTKPWGGTYDPVVGPPREEITVVNLRRVGDLAESVVESLRDHHRAGQLAIRPPLTVAAFHVQYGLAFREEPVQPLHYR